MKIFQQVKLLININNNLISNSLINFNNDF